MKHYTEKQIQFLKDNVKGISQIDLLNRFNSKFNENISISALRNLKVKHRLKSGVIGGRFEKGQTSWNKGKKWDEFMSAKGKINSFKTTFKKGNKPQNYRPVGSERISKDDYLEIKYQDPNKWESKHRYLYKKYYGEIPKNCVVIFADGNIRNFDKENLIAITKNENVVLNQNKLRFDNADITKSAINLAKLMIKTSEIVSKK